MRVFKIVLCALCVLAALAFAATQYYFRVYLDHTPPVISMDEPIITVSVKDGNEALLAGVTAMDDRDGDVSTNVMVNNVSQLTGANTAQVSYTVFDSSDNMGTASRTVCYSDYTAPRFTLIRPLNFGIGETVSLVGRVVAQDALEGNVTGAIRVSNLTLNNSVEGIYHVTLRVTNRMGDISSVTLPIIVRNTMPESPVLTLREYLVYVPQDSEFDPQDYFKTLILNGTEDLQGLYGSLKVISNVDTSVPGCYEVSYSYTNSSGYSADAVLAVVVEGGEVSE